MERNRLIAVVCAVIAFVCVLVAGKSCTDDALKGRKKNNNTSTTTASVEIIYPNANANDVTKAEQVETNTYETNILGQPIIPTTTAVQLDLFGRPITTEAEIDDDNTEDTETTAVETELVTDENGDLLPTEPASTAPPKISGFNHGEYDEDGNPIPTLPRPCPILW